MRAVPVLLTSLVLHACAIFPDDLPYEVQHVPASLETDPMPGLGDQADDPALWVNPTDSAQSLILGTDKTEGLYVYGLDGAERQFLPVGRVNNVDVRGAIAVASNDEVNGISWFWIRSGRGEPEVVHIGDTPVSRIEPYGICLGRINETLIAAVTYKDGAVELWHASESGPRLPDVELDRTVMFRSQLEGCVFDDAESRLFVGEEEHGIWSVDLASRDTVPVEVDTIAAGNGLVADVEGVSLYVSRDAGYLVASAQGADRFVIYDRLPPHRLVGGFRIAKSADGSVDRVSHTDGLDISASALASYPEGVLIVQDDGNPRSGVNQNFKLVDWREIEAAIERSNAAGSPDD